MQHKAVFRGSLQLSAAESSVSPRAIRASQGRTPFATAWPHTSELRWDRTPRPPLPVQPLCDAAQPQSCCLNRFVSTVLPQALARNRCVSIDWSQPFSPSRFRFFRFGHSWLGPSRSTSADGVEPISLNQSASTASASTPSASAQQAQPIRLSPTTSAALALPLARPLSAKALDFKLHPSAAPASRPGRPRWR